MDDRSESFHDRMFLKTFWQKLIRQTALNSCNETRATRRRNLRARDHLGNTSLLAKLVAERLCEQIENRYLY